MKSIVLLTSFILLFGSSSELVNTEEPKVINLNIAERPAFKVGEELSYRIHYGLVNAGRAELTIQNGGLVNGSPTYHMVGKGWTTGMTDWFFKVRDTYETFMIKDELVPVKFLRDIDEGGYKKKQAITFNRQSNIAIEHAKSPPQKYRVPNDVHDMVSAFYYARSLNTSGIKIGEAIPLKVFIDYEVFETQLKFKGKEIINSDLGKIECLVFSPLLQTDRVFKEKEGMTIYISNDKNKIPVRIQTDLAVGSIKIDITDVKNLAHPLRKI